MGFFDAMKKMIEGKPVFEVPQEGTQEKKWDDEQPRTEAASEPEGPRRVDSGGRKILPEAWVGRCKYHISGNHMQVHAHIHNHSQVPIFLDKIQLLNQTTELDYLLQPGGSWEFRIYNGAAPTSGAYTEANLYYRDNGNGDYFRARHYIEYHLEGNIYCVEELHPVRPVVDV